MQLKCIFFLKVIGWNEKTSLEIHEETEVLSTMDTWHWASTINQDSCPWNSSVHRPRHRTFTDEEEIAIPKALLRNSFSLQIISQARCFRI
jgi:hypothetical protein